MRSAYFYFHFYKGSPSDALMLIRLSYRGSADGGGRGGGGGGGGIEARCLHILAIFHLFTCVWGVKWRFFAFLNQNASQGTIFKATNCGADAGGTSRWGGGGHGRCPPPHFRPIVRNPVNAVLFIRLMLSSALISAYTVQLSIHYNFLVRI